MKTLPLTQGKVALVDDEDWERLSQYSWHAKRSLNTFYAKRRQPAGSKPTHVLLHHEILGSHSRCDHVDGDGLNCQKRNLRAATRSDNARGFRHKPTGTSSRFRGVSWYAPGKCWRACIGHSKKIFHIGYFKEESGAARAYDNAAKRFFGEFAQLNFPETVSK